MMMDVQLTANLIDALLVIHVGAARGGDGLLDLHIRIRGRKEGFTVRQVSKVRAYKPRGVLKLCDNTE